MTVFDRVGNTLSRDATCPRERQARRFFDERGDPPRHVHQREARFPENTGPVPGPDNVARDAGESGANRRHAQREDIAHRY
jgi:hypothetical protein